MPKILALDTSTEGCSVALNCDGKIVEEFVLLPREHTKQILPMIDRVLTANQLRLNELDAIAYASGPGSFTGLRIASGVVQGLAFGCDLPVIQISTLATLAYGVVKSLDEGDRGSVVVLSSLDARMNEIYWGCYRFDPVYGVVAIIDDQVCLPSNAPLPETLQHESPDLSKCQLYGVGNGWQFKSMFTQLPAGLVIVDHQNEIPRAANVAFLAMPMLAQGNTVSAEDAIPIYLRDTVSWKKRERIRPLADAPLNRITKSE